MRSILLPESSLDLREPRITANPRVDSSHALFYSRFSLDAVQRVRLRFD